MLVSGIILALYAWAYFAEINISGDTFLISTPAAVLAGSAFVAGIAAYLWTPEKYLFWGSLAAYIVLAATTAVLVLTTGGVSSPFIALWMIVSLFACIFGVYGLVPIFLALVVYLILQFTTGEANNETVPVIILAGGLPLIASYLLWRNKPANGNGTAKAYHQLATEFSQVAGKSEAVINAIADGVIALDSRGTIQLINPAAQQIIGWGKQDALSLDYKSVLKLLDKNDNELTPANDPISQVLATNKETMTTDLSLVTNSGKKILISVIVSPVGQPGSGVIVVFRDITKEKGEEREQAEFISTAAHEMRTPVASIEGYLGLALNPNTSQIDEKARDFIGKAHESAQHLGRLFQDLLDVSKAEDGRLPNNPKVVDVVAFAQIITQGFKAKAEEKGLRFLFKPIPDEDDKAGERRLNPVFYANVDNDHLREIISNLIDNAIKYTPDGDVVVDISGDSDHVVISVADSGIGIPKEDQAHLFQKFYRVDNSDTREIGGTGLGLYLCRRLAEAMNGRIWVESEYKRGSTFYLEIPRIDHEEATRLIESVNIQQKQVESESQPVTPMPLIPATPTQSTPAPQPQQPTPSIQAPPPAAPPIPSTSQQAPPPPASDTAYTNTPVETVVRQLQSFSPGATTSPPQQAKQALPQRPQIPQNQRANTPLTSIEQNPTEYIRTRPDGIPIPPRNQNKP